MRNKNRFLRAGTQVALAALLFGAWGAVQAYPGIQNDWKARYQGISASADNAGCQLCHAEANGGSPWNGYGWALLVAKEPGSGCDLNIDGTVSNAEAFFCTEMDDSDNNGADNLTEIAASAQPGWAAGSNNSLFSRSGETTGHTAPADIGLLDPAGTEPPPPVLPPPSDETASVPPGQHKRRTVVVSPGQSIQAAIDKALPGTRIYVLAGTYKEPGNTTNGLNISKSGISIIGQETKKKKVILENAGNQRNGIVVVPPDRTDCMSCHRDLKPPFDLLDGVDTTPSHPDPVIYGFEIRNITIKGFNNNGLFTERVKNFNIVNVHSVENPNYGIFPTLSSDGVISHSSAVGSDDSGMWVETSENVRVTHNLVANNVNGFEISNSDDIVLAYNEAYGNTVGIASLLLPDIFDNRPGAKRFTFRNNYIHDNNRPNTARPGSILGTVPAGIGILHLGVDDSLMTGNRIENNNFFGIVIADYCLVVADSGFSCDPADGPGFDPSITPEFIADQAATGNKVIGNVLVNNGTQPEAHPFIFAASDLSLVTDYPYFTEMSGLTNCYADNEYSTSFSFFFATGEFPYGYLPECQ
jgi:parallel beta-helix repeat protein